MASVCSSVGNFSTCRSSLLHCKHSTAEPPLTAVCRQSFSAVPNRISQSNVERISISSLLQHHSSPSSSELRFARLSRQKGNKAQRTSHLGLACGSPQALGGGNSPPFRGGRGRNGSSAWDPLLGAEDVCPVPPSQQPINEFKTLLDLGLFSWVTLSPLNYALRLVGLGAIFSALIGWPVASITYDPQDHPLQCIVASLAAGQVAATLAALRLYLGWAYVGNRLFSATVEYEETGWYDGQVWVKTPELLARDRLLASYEVKPVLQRLKATLLGLAVAVATSSSLLIFLPQPAPPAPSTSTTMETRTTIPGSYDPAAARFYEPSAFEDEDGDSEVFSPLPASCMTGLE